MRIEPPWCGSVGNYEATEVFTARVVRPCCRSGQGCRTQSMITPAGARVPHAAKQHVEDDCEIAQKHRGAQDCDAAHEPPRTSSGRSSVPRDEGNPFRPGTLLSARPIGLGKTQDRIAEGHRTAAHKRASVSRSAKSRKTCAECRSVLMCNRASRLSAITQASLCTSRMALSPINRTKRPLVNSKEATSRSRFLWARCKSIFGCCCRR